MNRRFWAGGLLVLTGCAGGGADVAEVAPERTPRIALAEVGDSVMYLEQTHAVTFIARPTDTLRVTSQHHAVVHVMRTAPDTLEGFYEHLVLRFDGGTQSRDVDTDSLLRRRYVLHEDDGRIETVVAPELPAEIRQMSDLRRQFEDFFLRLPDHDLTVGTEWVDTTRFGGVEGEGSTERIGVTRFRVLGDTVIEGLGARVIEYESALETNMRSAPTTQGTLVSHLVGGEEGTFVFVPEREVMLRRYRVGVLEGELVIEGNLETRRFPQSFSYESTIELIPPLLPGADPAPAADPDVATEQ